MWWAVLGITILACLGMHLFYVAGMFVSIKKSLSNSKIGTENSENQKW